MTELERTPITAPLPCFGLEHDPLDPICRNCTHEPECLKYMGSRASKLPLDRIRFNILPEAMAKREAARELTAIDPEAPYMERLYVDCFFSVFLQKPQDKSGISLYRKQILANATKSNCSLRMFFLANMVGHQVSEESVIDHTDRAIAHKFKVKHLTSKLAVSRCEAYAKLCRKNFGTFSLSSLSTLADTDYERSEVESNMLTSEVTAGSFIVAYKTSHGGPPYEALYAQEELQLDPYWLALEPTYRSYLLPDGVKREGTEVQLQHRFSVNQVQRQLARNPTDFRRLWVMRQRIMPEAVSRVLATAHYRPDDFLIENRPVLSALELWNQLGRAIQHYQCHQYLEGEPSVFSRPVSRAVNTTAKPDLSQFDV